MQYRNVKSISDALGSVVAPETSAPPVVSAAPAPVNSLSGDERNLIAKVAKQLDELLARVDGADGIIKNVEERLTALAGKVDGVLSKATPVTKAEETVAAEAAAATVPAEVNASETSAASQAK